MLVSENDASKYLQEIHRAMSDHAVFPFSNSSKTLWSNRSFTRSPRTNSTPTNCIPELLKIVQSCPPKRIDALQNPGLPSFESLT
jgi:hypothetical protein